MRSLTLPFRRSAGLTMIELMVTVAVLAILLAIAAPAFQTMIDNRRLTGAGDNLLADLRFAQSESVKRNAQVTVTVTPGSSWSYSVNSSVTKTTAGSDYRGTSLSLAASVPTVSGIRTLTFDPKRAALMEAGSTSSTLITITSASSQTLGIEVSPTSGLRLCTSTGFGGFPTCP